MRRQSVIQIAHGLIKKVPLDTIRGVIPDIRGMLEEREYRKMEKLGQKHGIPIPGMFLRRQIFSPDGHEEFDSGRQRSHTVNRNYYNLIFSQGVAKNADDTASFGSGFLSVKDTGGTIRGDADGPVAHLNSTDHDARSATAGLLATAGTTAIGIVAGTSSAAESFEGFELTALIANGSAAGEMDYSQSELHAITNPALVLTDTLIRDLNNNSGGGITAEEVGIYTGLVVAGSFRQTMITRDLTGGDVVADESQLRITYEVTLTYPS